MKGVATNYVIGYMSTYDEILCLGFNQQKMRMVSIWVPGRKESFWHFRAQENLKNTDNHELLKRKTC